MPASDFTFNGVHSSTYYVSLLNSPVSVFSLTRDKIITLPGRHGTLRQTPDLGERTWRLNCYLAASSLTQLQSRLDNLRAWLNPLLGEKQLIFDDTPDRYYKAMWAGGDLEAEIRGYLAFFELSMVCADPFAYVVTPQIVTIITSPYEHTQNGNAFAEPLLELKGTSTGDPQKLKVKIGDKETVYKGALASGDVLELDCALSTAVRVQGSSRANVLSSLETPIFPHLAAGANTITVTPVGGATWTELKIYCRNRYF